MEGDRSAAVAVVVPRFARPSGEGELIVRRLVGALAHQGRVDLLGGGRAERIPRSALAPIRHLPCRLGPGDEDDRRTGGALDRFEPADLIRQGGYPRVLLVGCSGAELRRLVEAAPSGSRLAVAPFACRDGALPGGLEDPAVVARVDRILVLGETEAGSVTAACSRSMAERVSDVGFAVRVHPLARRMPLCDRRRPTLVAVQDPVAEGPGDAGAHAALQAVAAALPGIRVCAIRIGGTAVRIGEAEDGSPAFVGAPMDLWRWMVGALAVVDLTRGAPLALRTLEAMMLGLPVLAPSAATAAAGHVRVSGGGLVFRSPVELVEGVRAIERDERASELGARGKVYAEARYGDPAGFAVKLRAALAA